jgi:hypothetical protein
MLSMLPSLRAASRVIAWFLAHIAYNVRWVPFRYLRATAFLPSIASVVTVLTVPYRIRPRILRASTSTVVRLIVPLKILAFSSFRAV